jgi:hypothetical protein
MNPVVVGNLEWHAILTAITQTSQPWDAAKVHLFKSNIVLTPATLLGDFTEADFTGYSVSGSVTWNAPGYLPDGTAVVVGDAKIFVVGSTPTVLNTIYGYYLTNSGGTALLFARSFDTPVVLSQAGNFVDVIPTYPAYVSN